MRSRISLRPIGSRPLIGSSSTTKAGSATSACAMPSRCCMPFEYLPDLPVGRVGRGRRARAARRSGAPRSAARHLGELREEAQRLGAGEELVVGRVLRQVADALLRALARDRRVEDEGPPARREDEPHQHLDGGRLAGAVRPDEAEDLALLDREREVVDGVDRGGRRPRTPSSAPSGPGVVAHDMVDTPRSAAVKARGDRGGGARGRGALSGPSGLPKFGRDRPPR